MDFDTSKYKDMPDDVKAFNMEADRLQRIHEREIADSKPKTPEQIERDKEWEQFCDGSLDLIAWGKKRGIV